MHRFRLIFALLASTFWAGFPVASYGQSGAEMLTAAAKLGEKRDYTAAIEKISEAFKAGKLDNAASSKAFLMRGEAYEKLNKDALALADYTSAVFMQGLSATDRLRAVDGRKRTLAALGVSENDGGAKPLGATQSAEAPKSSSGGFLSGLFGGSSTSAEAKPEETGADGWSQGTRVTTAPPAPVLAPAPVPKAAAPAPSPAIESGSKPVRQAAVADDVKQYSVLLASLPTEDVAQAEAKRMASRLVDLLEGKTLEVVRYEKSGAVFFRVVAGPYEGSAHSKEICESVKAKNVSCLVISR